MKNIEKKWMLFIIATFVTFAGIGYTLVKGTQAADSVVEGNCDFSTLTASYGDVNKDNIVDEQDDDDLNKYLADWDEYSLDCQSQFNADVNVDGVVDTLDSIILNRYINKWIGYDKLPYTSGFNHSDEFLSSSKYVIGYDEEKDLRYIFVGTDKDVETIKKNLELHVTVYKIDMDLENNNLYVMYEGDVKAEYKLFIVDATEYDLTKDYIYFGTNEIDSEEVIKENINRSEQLTLEVSEDKRLLVKYDDSVLKEYLLFNISFGEYKTNDEKSYIYLGYENLDIEKIEKSDFLNVYEDDNDLVVKFGLEEIIRYPLVKISSSEYDLTKDYIYLGTSDFNEGNLTKINCVADVIPSENRLSIMSLDGVEITRYNLIKIEKTDYDLSKGYVYLANEVFDEKQMEISGKAKVVYDEENEIIQIQYDNGSVAIYEYPVISLDTKYILSDDYIYLGTEEFNEEEVSVSSNSNIKIEDNTLFVVENDNPENVIDSYKLINISSDTYNKFLEKDYIYLGTGRFDINKIKVTEPAKVSLHNNSVLIMYENKILDDYSLINLSSTKYNLGKDYIYLGYSELNNNDFTVSSPAYIKKVDNEMRVMYGEEDILDSYSLITLSSSIYDLSDHCIYVGTGSFDASEIVVSQLAKVTLHNNDVLIMYENEILDSYPLIKLSSEKYDLTKKYIYAGTNDVNINDIKVTEPATVIKNDNELLIMFNGKVVSEYPIIKLSSTKYDLSKDYIYLNNSSFALDQIVVTESAKVMFENDKVMISYDGDTLAEYTFVDISSTKYDLSKDYIYLGFDPFNKSDINLLNCTIDVESDTNKLVVYYEDEEIKEYSLIKFTETLDVDITKKYIKYLESGTKVSGLLSNFENFEDIVVLITDMNGEIKRDDNLVASGDILSIHDASSGTSIETFELSVIGDSNGDGEVDQIDLVQMRKHIVGWINPNTNLIENKTGIYYYSLDFNKDGEIDLIDLIRLRKKIVEAI